MVYGSLLKQSVFFRNITGKGNGIAQSTTPLLMSRLNCGGYETDIGYCTAEFDRDTCSEKVVEIDCSGNQCSKWWAFSCHCDNKWRLLVCSLTAKGLIHLQSICLLRTVWENCIRRAKMTHTQDSGKEPSQNTPWYKPHILVENMPFRKRLLHKKKDSK